MPHTCHLHVFCCVVDYTPSIFPNLEVGLICSENIGEGFHDTLNQDPFS
jgi:hypothetical protein